MAAAQAGDEVYTCQHGGPGELVVANKNLFVVSYAHNLEQARKQQGWAQYQEILATELVVLEELLTQNETLKNMVDATLMKLYFGMATDALLKARLEPARVYARAGVYVAMYLRHGEALWNMTKEDAAVQQETLQDMYVALGKIALDAGLPELLNAQTPCTCLEQAFPALKNKK